MAWIFVDKEEEGGSKQQMRSNMRRMMRGGYRGNGGSMDGSSYHDGYRQGYKHGWEDKEDEWEDEEMNYRRRDSRGRYIWFFDLKGFGDCVTFPISLT